MPVKVLLVYVLGGISYGNIFQLLYSGPAVSIN